MSKEPQSAAPLKDVPATTPSALKMIMEVFGGNRVLTISAVIFIAVVFGAAVFFVIRSAPPSTITITSGPVGSVFQTYAVKYARLLARHGVKLNILTSEGSQENLQRLGNPAFAVDIGFVQGGVTNGATAHLVSLGSLAHQPLLIFYRGAPVELLSDFAGKRLAIGPVGSGTRDLTLSLLAANEIQPGGTTTLLDLDPAAASQALLAGTVDAVFLMGEGASITILRRLVRAPGIHLFNFTQATAYSRRFSYLSVLQLPQGGIDLGSNLPPHDVTLIGPTVELIARDTLHPALSDLLLEAAREIHGNGTLLQRKGEFPAPLEHDFRLSPDAVRFYKSGKSLFYRYLPFWLASLTSRIVVVFVPMLVLLIPVLRGIPAIYRWRIRSRIFRWYRILVALERELTVTTDSVKRQELLQRLDEIEVTVNQMKVPTFYGDLFYGLRSHIDLVRQFDSRNAATGHNRAGDANGVTS